jgi:CBS domain-containing protein
MLMEDLKKKPVSWLRSVERSQDTSKPPVIEKKASLQEAANKLDDNHRVLAICDNNQNVVGAISQSDISKWIGQQKDNAIKTDIPVEQIMPGDFVKINENDSVDYLISQILSNKFDQVVLMDRDGKYFGIVDRNKLADEIEEQTR